MADHIPKVRTFLATARSLLRVIVKGDGLGVLEKFPEANDALMEIAEALRPTVPNINTERSPDAVYHIQSLMTEALELMAMSEPTRERSLLAVASYAVLSFPKHLIDDQVQFIQKRGPDGLASNILSLRLKIEKIKKAAVKRGATQPSTAERKRRETVVVKLTTALFLALTKK